MKTKMSRRKFLVAASAGGIAAAAAVASRTDGTGGEGKQAAKQGKGYQLTAHVRRYYETTKV